MASKTSISHLAFFLSLNLLFFTLVSANCTCESKPPPPPVYSSPPPPPVYSPPPPPPVYSSPPPTPVYYFPPPPPQPKPTPPSTPSCSPPPAHGNEKCPRDALKIGVCAKLLNNDLLKIILGNPPVTPCCTLVVGLADFEAALCLCTAIKASVLGIHLNDVPVSLELLVNNCGRKIPPGFKCP